MDCMVECHSRLPLALKLQRRSTLAGFLVNALSAAMLALYMTVVFPPDTDSVIITRGSRSPPSRSTR